MGCTRILSGEVAKSREYVFSIPDAPEGKEGRGRNSRMRDEVKKEGIMKEEEIIARIREAAKEGKLPCAMAMKIAAESKISNKEMGDLLNRLKIKVAQCQLGCF